MIKKTENFQNSETPPVKNIDLIKNYIIRNIHYIFLIIFGILHLFFPSAALIVNSIFLLLLLFITYKFLYIDKRFSGDGIFLAILIPPIIFISIYEIYLLYTVYNLKKPEESDSD